MICRRMIALAAVTGLSVLAVLGQYAPAIAQSYPSRTITLVIPLPPGGTNDIMARAVADKMSAALGQQVIVESRAAGGSGTVATRQIAHAAPDGYTLLLGYTSTLATGPNLVRNVGYDVRTDFAPIGMIATAPSLLMVHPQLPVRSVVDLIRLMKESKEPYQIGTTGSGTVGYLVSLLFAEQAGVRIEPILYKGSNQLNTDLIGGHVKVGFNPIPVSRGTVEGGLIRALAVTSQKRSTLMADVPTIAESGLPDFDAILSYGLLAPAKTPKPIIERLNTALNGALATEEVRKRIIQEGAEPEASTPEQYGAVIDREEARWSKIVRAAGLNPQ